METSTEMLTNILTFGLVIGSLVIALLIGAAQGGWKFGDLLRRVDFSIDHAELPAFTERLQRRLTELGFTATQNAGEFFQGGQVFRDAGAFTHAKTPKFLRVAVAAPAAPHTTVQLALHYQDTIVADTGEGSYRDAVLEYISGRTNEMKPVPNRSYMAVCSAVGGFLAWVALVVCQVTGISKFYESVFTIGITYTIVGLYSIIAIARKPGQATGMVWAIAGVAGCASALVATTVLKWIIHH